MLIVAKRIVPSRVIAISDYVISDNIYPSSG